MTLAQSHELATLARSKGYVLSAWRGKVQFQVLRRAGSIQLRITEWLAYDEPKELLTQGNPL